MIKAASGANCVDLRKESSFRVCPSWKELALSSAIAEFQLMSLHLCARLY